MGEPGFIGLKTEQIQMQERSRRYKIVWDPDRTKQPCSKRHRILASDSAQCFLVSFYNAHPEHAIARP
jgi:hypothetical protein